MGQAYSDPEREDDPHALPDIEVFEIKPNDVDFMDEEGHCLPAGWYWWTCLPGCLPDSEPIGPFESEEAALEDARYY